MSKYAPVKQRNVSSAPVPPVTAPALDVDESRSRAGHTILVVSRQTGLGMETLRAWERRYGFPKPQRKEGSNRRVYTDADIEHLNALKRTIEAGYRIGDLVNKSMAELALLAAVPRKAKPGDAASAPNDASLPEGGELTELDPLLRLLAADDIGGLEARLRHAASALGPRRFVTEIAHPFVVRVGEAWAEGRINIAQEHIATESVTTRVRQVLAGYQDLEGHPTVLLATLPGEPHGLGLSMVALYLAVKSARPRLLGVDTPPAELARAAGKLGADVVGVTVTRTIDKKVARRALVALRAALPAHIPIWLGGAGAGDVDPGGKLSRHVQSWEAIDLALADYRSLTSR